MSTDTVDTFEKTIYGVVAEFDLPPAGSYGAGLAFLPADPQCAEKAVTSIESLVADEGLVLLGWRQTPIDPSSLGATALAVMPAFRQLFVADPREERDLAAAEPQRARQLSERIKVEW